MSDNTAITSFILDYQEGIKEGPTQPSWSDSKVPARDNNVSLDQILQILQSCQLCKILQESIIQSNCTYHRGKIFPGHSSLFPIFCTLALSSPHQKVKYSDSSDCSLSSSFSLPLHNHPLRVWLCSIHHFTRNKTSYSFCGEREKRHHCEVLYI
jgi:hypothetical protein